jgi:hypothetical protein
VLTVNALVCDCRIDDGAFSSLLDLDGHCAALILVCDQRSDVGLDTTSTEANDDDSCDVSTECMASGDRCGKSSRPENQQTDPVNRGEDQDCVVFAEVLISDNCSAIGIVLAYRHQVNDQICCLLQNGGDVGEPLEKQVETSGTLVTKSKTGRAISTIGTVVDVVLEETLASVVGESFCELDNGDQVCGGRQVLADPAQGALLVLVGFSSFWCRLRLDVGVLDNGMLLVNQVGGTDVAARSIALVVRDALAELLVQPGLMSVRVLM